MAKAALFTDNFTTVSNSKWGGYGSNPTVSGGQLNITPTGSYPGLYSAIPWDLSGSSVMVRLVQPPNIGNGSNSAALNVQVSPNNIEEIAWDNGNLIFREKVSGTASDVSITYDSVAHAWLRIREASGTVYWETSPDALNWTTRRSKASGLGALTSVTINLYAGFWGTEPSPGVAKFDNLNVLVAPANLTGWSLGMAAGGGTDGGTVLVRNYFDIADWLWSEIPASPVLHANSATWAGYFSQPTSNHMALMYEYGVKIIPATTINSSTPRYDVQFRNVPAWGNDPFGTDTVPLPVGTPIPVGSDGHVLIADPVSGKAFGLWQAAYSSGVLSASWGGVATLHGNGIDYNGSATATGFSRLAGVVGANEFATALLANSGLKHALFIASNATSLAYVPPAIKSDGTNAAGVAKPVPQGTRFYLDPTIDVDSISGITDGEKVIAKTLQTYGAYVGDKNDSPGAAGMGFLFELADGTNPGAVYAQAGLGYDYFDMTHIPWGSLRFLNSWNGT